MGTVIRHFRTSSILKERENIYLQLRHGIQVHKLKKHVLLELNIIIPIDDQSIATRLAKKIGSSTTSLKRAISRFNGMPRDVFEGTMYVLSDTLQWETVINMEELSTLEISSFANRSTIKIPIDI